MAIREMVSLEEARELVLSRVPLLDVEEVGVLNVIGRVAAQDLASDIDIAPFAHSAMDGFALRAEQLADATPEVPVELDVIAEIPAGSNAEEGPAQRWLGRRCRRRGRLRSQLHHERRAACLHREGVRRGRLQAR